jgi:uncharacterized protein YggE
MTNRSSNANKKAKALASAFAVILVFTVAVTSALYAAAGGNAGSMAAMAQEQQPAQQSPMMIMMMTGPHNLAASASLQANANVTTKNEHIMFISSTASVKTAPDQATVEIRVETRGETAQLAVQNNTMIMQNVTAALERIGMQKNETQTTAFNVIPEMNYTQSPPKLIDYMATNSLSVTTKNITSVGNIIDAAISAGATGINSLDFSVSDKKMGEIRENLTHVALQMARTSADAMAKDLGVVKVVDVQSVSASVSVLGQNQFRFNTQPLSFAFREAAGAAQAPPIVPPSTQTVSVSVSVTFVISKV